MLEYLIVFILILCGLYFWFAKDHGYWKKRGVTYVQPNFLVGNMGSMVAMKKSFGQIFADIYNDHKDEAYVGVFNMKQPSLLIRDLDIIKNILIKDFNKFHDNSIEIDERADPVLSKNPFFLRGERWKIVRSHLTPLLTTAKTKAMFPLVQEVCKTMVRYLEEEKQVTGNDGIEAKELALKFTADNVASCAFGLEGHSFDEPDSEFRKMAQDIMKVTIWGMMRFFLFLVLPALTKYLRISIGSEKIVEKFKDILMRTIKYREENKIVRNDFLDSIIELKSKPMPFDYTSDYMVAHALTFFLDGSETSATVFAFAMYELAVNPQIQTKLEQEVQEVLTKYEGNITFEAIQQMSYLDAIFLETLRKYPPLLAMTRECTEENKLSNTTGRELIVEKGVPVIIPVYALHHDPQYYPDPDHFDPDRFTDETKFRKNCFFGFGDGPRICLGQRFAHMQIKAGLVAVVSNFEIRPSRKVKMPLEMSQSSFILETKDGIWLKFYRRNEK